MLTKCWHWSVAASAVLSVNGDILPSPQGRAQPSCAARCRAMGESHAPGLSYKGLCANDWFHNYLCTNNLPNTLCLKTLRQVFHWFDPRHSTFVWLGWGCTPSRRQLSHAFEPVKTWDSLLLRCKTFFLWTASQELTLSGLPFPASRQQCCCQGACRSLAAVLRPL